MLHATVAGGDDDDDDYDDDNDDSDNDDDDNADDVVHNSTLPLPDVDEAPEDLHAFFVHPLTAATRASGDGDAMALLHEYRNLPVLDVGLSSSSKYVAPPHSGARRIRKVSVDVVFSLFCLGTKLVALYTT